MNIATDTDPIFSETQRHADRINGLDAFRLLAILLVASYHYTVRWAAPNDITTNFPSGHFPAGQAFQHFVPLSYGWVGVELFFLISGFVIRFTLEQSKGLIDFAVRRFARLWPPLFVCAILTSLISNHFGPADWHVDLPSFLLSNMFLPPEVIGKAVNHNAWTWVDGVYWSLWVEVRFYVLAAIAFRISPRHYLHLIILAELIGAASHIFFNGSMRAVVELALQPEYLPYFGVGSCCLDIFLRRPRVTSICALGISVVLIFAISQPLLSMSLRLPMLGTSSALFAVIALFIIFSAWPRLFDGPLSRWLAELGRYSYSFYLIHQKVGIIVLVGLIGLGVWPLAAIISVLFSMLALSLSLFVFVERPARRLIIDQTRELLAQMSARWRWQLFSSR